MTKKKKKIARFQSFVLGARRRRRFYNSDDDVLHTHTLSRLDKNNRILKI